MKVLCQAFDMQTKLMYVHEHKYHKCLSTYCFGGLAFLYKLIPRDIILQNNFAHKMDPLR